MMKRRTAVITTALILLLTIGSVGVFAQESESDVFVRELVRTMSVLGWPESELAQVERNLLTYRWEQMRGVDPETVALALEYGRERGGLGTDGETTAAIASNVALAAREMVALGMTNREITRVMLDGVREVVESRTRESYDEAAEGEQIREQIQSQLRERQEDALRTELKTRLNNPKDPESWNPGKPTAPPTHGDIEQPRGAGDGTADQIGSDGGPRS